MQKVKIKKLSDGAKIPVYGTSFSAGCDLSALSPEPVLIPAGTSVLLHTGLSMEIPEGLVGLIFARSGLACKKGLAPANKVGVIDSDYRGEICVVLHNHGEIDQVVTSGERIAQMVFVPYITAMFDEVDSLSDTERGEGGFGSTGRV